MMKKNRFYFILIFFFLVIDQLTKAWITKNLGLYSRLEVIPGFFNLVHTRNKGVIFGFFSQSNTRFSFIILTIASLAAFSLVVYFFIKTPSYQKGLKVSLSLILAGATGNLIDRILKGYVIDFLDFGIESYHWPSFNIADSCISIGALLMIYNILFKREAHCSQSS